MKQLKFWNGRAHGRIYAGGFFNVAAHSKKQAAELISSIEGVGYLRVNEITTYYSSCWGNDMKDIVATEPCVYYTTFSSEDKPLKLI
jgi:hypothetical protein